jgi:hypothetical protein
MKPDPLRQIHLAAALFVHFFEQKLYYWIAIYDGRAIAKLFH